MRFATTLTVALVSASLGIVPAKAATISMECSADAWGLSSYYNETWNADTNYGAQTDAYGTVMQASWKTDGLLGNKFWQKFDLSTVSGTAESAALRLTRKGGSTDGYDAVLVYALNDQDAGEGWGEYTLTYNNAPGNVLAANEVDLSRYTYVGNLDYAKDGAVGDVVTMANYGTALRDAVNSDTDGRLTLAFLKKGYDANNGAVFASREDTFYQGGTLVLGVPEPGAVVLLCMGLTGLLAYAWRKRK